MSPDETGEDLRHLSILMAEERVDDARLSWSAVVHLAVLCLLTVTFAAGTLAHRPPDQAPRGLPSAASAAHVTLGAGSGGTGLHPLLHLEPTRLPADTEDEYHASDDGDPGAGSDGGEGAITALLAAELRDERSLATAALSLTAFAPTGPGAAPSRPAGPAPDPRLLASTLRRVLADLGAAGSAAAGPVTSSPAELDAPAWLDLEFLGRRTVSAMAAAGAPGIHHTVTRGRVRERLTLSHPSLRAWSLDVVKPAARARAAIIVDDVGFGTASTAELLRVEAPLAIAVMPFLRGSSDAVRLAHARGYDVLLHMPMEPRRFKQNVVPSIALMRGLPETELRRRFRTALDSLPPGVMGVNNHMGSEATEDPTLMRVVADELRQRGLFFVDSVTTHASCAYQLARLAGVPSTRRNVEFIDNKRGVEWSVAQLRRLIAAAPTTPRMVAIMHDRPDSVAALSRMLPRFHAAGIELTFVSGLLDGGVGEPPGGTLVHSVE